jgi:hypothetical protein
VPNRPDETSPVSDEARDRDDESQPDHDEAGGDGDDDAADTPPAGPSRREKQLEVVAVTLLAITALATAWSGYQASLWDGIQSSNYTQASGARTNAAQQRTEANELRVADLTVFENYIDARIDGDEAVADFYRQRFRDEFEPAFEAWDWLDPLNNPDAPPTPLAMPEYQLDAEDQASELEARADRLFAEGEDANTISDIYTLTTLLFAIVLFFAAISERFEYLRVRIGLLTLGGIGFVTGLVIAFSQPITTG